MDDTSELIRAMREMRTAQKTYFLTRTKEALQASKGWEKKVDDMLAAIAKPEQPKQPKQGTLFG